MLLGIPVLLETGRRLGLRRLAEDPESDKSSDGAVLAFKRVGGGNHEPAKPAPEPKH